MVFKFEVEFLKSRRVKCANAFEPKEYDRTIQLTSIIVKTGTYVIPFAIAKCVYIYFQATKFLQSDGRARAGQALSPGGLPSSQR